jgi:GT2 family glycosyltransferase
MFIYKLLLRDIFDVTYYRSQNLDVRESHIDPLEHFAKYGIYEGRRPNPQLDLYFVVASFKYLINFLHPIFIYRILKVFRVDKYYSELFITRMSLFDLSIDNYGSPVDYFKIFKLKSRFKFFILILDYITAKKFFFKEYSEVNISVVVINWQKFLLTYLLLRELYYQDCQKIEIILINNEVNFSTRILHKRFPNMIIINNLKNEGYPKAVNQGISLASGKNILLLNNDALPMKGWEIVVSENFNDPLNNVQILGGVLLNGSLKVAEIGGNVWKDGTCDPICKGLSFNNLFTNQSGEVDYLSGAFMVVRKEVFKEIGFFDEKYSPAYYEDVDFCLRAKSKGFKVKIDRRLVSYHIEHASSSAVDATKLIKINFEYFTSKNRELLESNSTKIINTNLKTCIQNGSNKKRVLFIDSISPIETNGRGAPRQNLILKSLQKDLNLTFCYRDGEFIDVHNVFGFLPDSSVILVGPMNDRLFSDFLTTYVSYIDALWISRVSNLKFVMDLIDLDLLPKHIKIIFDFESLNQDTFRFFDEIKLKNLNSKNIFDFIDMVFCVSAVEQDLLRKIGIDSHVLGYFENSKPRIELDSKNNHFLFLGNLEIVTDPNFLFLAEFISYLEQTSDGKAILSRFKVVGKLSSLTKKFFDTHGISAIGEVVDLDYLFENTLAMFVPSFEASGIPLKLIKAASYSTPCVVTPILAEQMNWVHEQECLVASSFEEFKVALARIIDNRALRYDIGNGAWQSQCNGQSKINFENSINKVVNLMSGG